MKDSIAKEKKWGKKCLEILPLRGGRGVRRLMANAIFNFHFVFWNPSLNWTLRLFNNGAKIYEI